MRSDPKASPHNFAWGYNDRSELTAADRYSDLTPGTHTAAPFAWDYAYDNIGNRNTYNVDDGDPPPETSYTANDLNQYTGLTNPAEYLCYDDDGNLLQSGKPTANCATADGAWKYVWDAENRLVGMHTGDLASPQPNDKWLEFKYDYMGP